ncbi:MAG: 3-deoxy-7-phosphoheptulonate synthase [Armatimonadota bacterium]
MVILPKPGCTDEQLQEILRLLDSLGYSAHISRGVERTVIGAVGAPDSDRSAAIERLESLPQVERVVPVLKPYKLVSRDFQPQNTVVRVGNVAIGDGSLTVMAGPCTVESRDQLLQTAKVVKEAGAKILRGGAYKPSTSPYSFQGLGVEGLKLLSEARAETGLPVITEVLDPRDVEVVCEHADILQIGARNMSNFSFLKEVGSTRKPVMLKRGMSATLEEWLHAAEYIAVRGNTQILLCERGIRTFETATRNTFDINAIPAVQQLSHLPVVADPSHGTGRRSLVGPVARAAVAAGADAVIVEVHPEPSKALKDGAQSLTFEDFRVMMKELKCIASALGRCM